MKRFSRFILPYQCSLVGQKAACDLFFIKKDNTQDVDVLLKPQGIEFLIGAGIRN
jgi:hypothetical protein